MCIVQDSNAGRHRLRSYVGFGARSTAVFCQGLKCGSVRPLAKRFKEAFSSSSKVEGAHVTKPIQYRWFWCEK